MQSPILADATDLTVWADRRDAQGVLPRLVRRLVHATVCGGVRLGFPAGEGVQLGGWDGIAEVHDGNEFVPAGTSAWEMGTNRDRKRKADADYEKRLEDPLGIDRAQSTFVFVTPRRWDGKSDWAAARREEGAWRDVRAYDADDLEEWLELAPAVHLWFSIQIGKHPPTAADLESTWVDWADATEPAITSELLLSGRTELADRIHSWIASPSAPLALQAETRGEALAVFAGSVQQLPPEERIAVLSRSVVVHDLAAGRQLCGARDPLILVQAYEGAALHGLARRGGHAVVVPLGRAEGTSPEAMDIPPVSREEAAKTLGKAGIEETRARELAALARRSFAAFRRKIALVPELQRPEWSSSGQTGTLLAVALASRWDDSMGGDREAVSALTGSAYGETNETLVRWSVGADPPMRRVGDAWIVTSREDAWSLLAGTLTRDHLDRLAEVVLSVLGEPDPRFDLPADQRWMAGAIGHAPRHSALLREGLADTLALMGARDVVSEAAGVSLPDRAIIIVRELLARANADWRVWASLAPVLPRLAEAAPDVFLGSVEAGLSGDEPVVGRLFTEHEEHVLLSTSPHPGLLWALETLAWSPAYLGRAALVLARLVNVEPEGERHDGPRNCLRSIFLPWLPQTAAPLEARLRVLDLLRDREPQVAWGLMCDLVDGDEVGGYGARPRWRGWAPDPSPTSVDRDYVRTVQEIASRMIADAGAIGDRWRDLVHALPSLPPDAHESVVDSLSTMEVEPLADGGSDAVWCALRDLIAKHRSFPDASWALPAGRVDILAQVLPRFEPRAQATRYAWLFSARPPLVGDGEADRAAQREAADASRLEAVHAIHEAEGVGGLLAFVGHVERPGEVGFVLGQSELLDSEEEADLLSRHLAVDDEARAQLAGGFAAGRVRSRGRDWIEEKLAELPGKWTPSQRGALLTCLPFDARTWDLVEEDVAEVRGYYWRRVLPWGLRESDEVWRVAATLIEHERPHSAIELLARHATSGTTLPASLIADALERGLQSSPAEERVSSTFPHDVAVLLGALDQSSELPEQRVASLQWQYLPALERGDRSPTLLHRELGRNPGFFVELLSLTFRAEDEEPREHSAEDEARARNARRLLDTWRVVPGTSEAGEIETDELLAWVREARKAAASCGRGAIGDNMIGRVLSGAPAGEDGVWPHPAVRDVIEEVGGSDLDRGLIIGVFNAGGVRYVTGGEPERGLAAQYTEYASYVCDRWPRTAALLRQLADWYRVEAERMKRESDLFEETAGP